MKQVTYKCECLAPQLGVVDGDRQSVFCAVCAGVLGELEDVVLVPAKEPSDRPYEPQKEDFEYV